MGDGCKPAWPSVAPDLLYPPLCTAAHFLRMCIAHTWASRRDRYLNGCLSYLHDQPHEQKFSNLATPFPDSDSVSSSFSVSDCSIPRDG